MNVFSSNYLTVYLSLSNYNEFCCEVMNFSFICFFSHLFVFLFIYFLTCLAIIISIYLSKYLSVCLSILVPVLYWELLWCGELFNDLFPWEIFVPSIILASWHDITGLKYTWVSNRKKRNISENSMVKVKKIVIDKTRLL